MAGFVRNCVMQSLACQGVVRNAVSNEAWWRRWESNPRPRNSDRRCLRVQPTGFVSSPGQSVGTHAGGPAPDVSTNGSGLPAGPARLNGAEPWPTGRAVGSARLLTQPVRSRCWQLCLPHPFYERMDLDTLPTAGHVPRRAQYAPRFDSTAHSSISLAARPREASARHAFQHPRHARCSARCSAFETLATATRRSIEAFPVVASADTLPTGSDAGPVRRNPEECHQWHARGTSCSVERHRPA